MNARNLSMWWRGKEEPNTPVKEVRYAGCEITYRCEFGEPGYDVMKDGVYVAHRGTLTGAKMAADARGWEKKDWWKKMKEKEDLWKKMKEQKS